MLQPVNRSAALLSQHRKLWLPFAGSALVELFLLVLFWLAPLQPFSILLGPPVRYFFGEQALHYPHHLLALYQFMRAAHTATMISVGAFLSGLACEMVRNVAAGQPASVHESLFGKRVSYLGVTVAWLTTWLAAKGVMDFGVGQLPRQAWAVWAGIAAMVVLQALFVYIIPVVVLGRLNWFRAFYAGIRETLLAPLSTLAMISLPMAAVVAVSGFSSTAHVVVWMQRFCPEIVFPLIGLRIAIWTAADAWMSVGIAWLWLQRHSGRQGL